jgi:hypothetical protein
MTKATTDYEPDSTALATRPADAELDTQLTSVQAVDRLATALREAAFDLEQDDLVTIATADTLVITDADAYARGYELLHELGEIEDRCTKHYNRFDKPLNFLIGVVRKLKGPQIAQVTPTKQALAKRLGAWKQNQERLDREQRERDQALADAQAKAAQAAKAAVLERVADGEPDPALAKAFQSEAAAVRSVDVHGAPVEARSSVPVIPGGYTRATWKCEFDDVKELLRAYIDGRCFLDEDAIKKGLQSSMDDNAANLTVNLGKAFPGTHAVKGTTAVRRRTR